jgi:hypothetical protein
MATGTILLAPQAAVLPDGSTDNIPPAMSRLKGSQSGADLHKLVLAYDGAGSVHESAYWSFILPQDYASGGTLRITGTINSTTGNVARMQAQVGAVTAADADTPLEHAFGAAANIDITANTTEARRLLTGSVALTMDSAAAGDEITIRLFRDPANGSDTHTSDFELWDAAFEYTTT